MHRIIRKATMADAAAVAEIYVAALELEAQGKLTTGWLPGVYPVRATAEAALDRDDLFVMEEDGAIVGTAIINQIQVDSYAGRAWQYDCPDGEIMVLHTLVIHPSCGHRGLGREFVAYYEDYARAHGCTELRMDTQLKNLPARALYKKLGYAEVDTVDCVFNNIPNVHLVLLEKKL